MTDTPRHQTADQTASTQVDSQPLTINIQQIDESFYQHVSAEYWAWRAVFEQDPEARINQHPDFVLTELSFSRETAHCPPTLITCRRGSRTVGAAILVPKSIAGEKKFGPAWDLRGYRLAGNRLLGDSDLRTQNSLLDGINDQLESCKADFLLAEDVETDDSLLELVQMGSHGLQVFKPAPFQQRHKIELPETLEDYWKTFAGKTRSTLRRKVKQFGECRLERISKPFQITDFLENAQRISKRSWQTDLLGLRVHNDEFELQLFTFLATQGSLRAYLLWQGDVPVSFCIGNQHNGVFHYEEVGYDRDYSKKSPGQILVIKMIEEMYSHEPPQVFDFGGGHAEYKRQFGTRISESGHIWLLRPGLRSRLIVGYLNGRRMMSQAMRSALARTGLLERVRRWTRRGLSSS